MTEKKEGPSISINVSCSDCKYLETEYYQVQDDTGFHKYCTFGGQKKDTGSGYNWTCPDWCPIAPDVANKVRHIAKEITEPKPDEAIDVQELIESGADGGGFLGWYAKGHHGAWQFADAVNRQHGLAEDSWRFCRADQVRQTYYRTVPVEGGEFREYRECEGPKPGAWAVTLADIHWQRTERRFAEDQTNRDQGRREALRWVAWFVDQNDGRVPDVHDMCEWSDARAKP